MANKEKVPFFTKVKNWKPVRYIREMFGELKKLTWLTGKELASHTFAVIVFVIGMALVIYVLDLAFSTGFSLLEKVSIG